MAGFKNNRPGKMNNRTLLPVKSFHIFFECTVFEIQRRKNEYGFLIIARRNTSKLSKVDHFFKMFVFKVNDLIFADHIMNILRLILVLIHFMGTSRTNKNDRKKYMKIRSFHFVLFLK